MYFYTSLASLQGVLEPILKLADKFGVSWPLLTAQGINFCLVVFMLYRFAFRPIIKTLDQRQKIIEDGVKQAQESRDTLIQAREEAKQLHKKANLDSQEILLEAKKQAKTYLDEQVKKTHLTVEEILQKARKEIQSEHLLMVQSAKKELSKTVVAAASKVLHMNMTAKQHEQYMQAAMQAIQETSTQSN